MNLDELFEMNSKQLNKLKKEELVKTIAGNAWYYSSQKSTIKNAEAEIKALKAPYNQAKEILIGITGEDVPKNEYTGKYELDKVDLCYLIGALLRKAS